MPFFKRSKPPESSLLTAKVPDTFDYSSQVNYTNRTDKNFKSIYSYHPLDKNENDEDKESTKDHSFKIWTYTFGFILFMFFPVLCWFSVKIVTKNKKLVVYRCGKLWKIKGPGISVTIPFIDTCQFVDTEMNHCCINDASCPTRDQGLVEMDCLVKYRIVDPEYLIRSVIDWKEHVSKEMRVALTQSVYLLKWSDFHEFTRVNCDIETQMKKYLQANQATRGLEIHSIETSNIRQIREPESPMEFLKKINFKDLGRHLSSMAPMFMGNLSLAMGDNTGAAQASGATPGSVPGSSQPCNELPKNKALEQFFEKLEVIKNIALENQKKKTVTINTDIEANNESTSPSTSSAASYSVPSQIPTNLSSPCTKDDSLSVRDATDVKSMFIALVKEFIKKNMSWHKAMELVQDNSLQALFDEWRKDETEKRKLVEMSEQIGQLAELCQIHGNILFVVKKYFKEPCYFHWNQTECLLENGFIDEYGLLVCID